MAEAAPAAPPRPAPRAAPAPRPAPQPTPATLPPDPAEPTAADVAQARADLALAFGLIAEAQTQARDAIESDAGHVASTVTNVLPF